MGRVAFFIFAAVIGFAYWSDVPAKEFVEKNLLWAALLPPIYILGVAFLED